MLAVAQLGAEETLGEQCTERSGFTGLVPEFNLIASFSGNFIFVRTRKTASTSTEIVLGTVCKEEDVVTPVGVEDELIRREHGGSPRNFCNDPDLESRYRTALERGDRVKIAELYDAVMRNLKFHHHMSAFEIRELLPAKFWNNAFKFSVDRHPYEKVVSLAYWRGRNEDLANRAILDRWIDKLVESRDYQNSLLYLIDGRVAVDRVLQYENLESELHRVAVELNLILPKELPRAKGQYRRDRRAANDILHDYQKRRIREVCVFDFDVLGYQE